MTEPSLISRLCTLCGVPSPGASFGPAASGQPTARIVPWKAAALLTALGTGAATVALLWDGSDAPNPAAANLTAGASVPTGDHATGLTAAAPRLLPQAGPGIKPVVPQTAEPGVNSFAFHGQRVRTAGGLTALQPAADDLAAELLEPPIPEVPPSPAVAAPQPLPEPPETADAVRALEEPAPPAPAAAPQSGEVILSFNFQSAPWDLVLTRFAETVGLPLQMKTVPPGTLTYYDPRPYTATETLHILNHFLRPSGCALVRDGGTLTVLDLRTLPQPASPEPASPEAAAQASTGPQVTTQSVAAMQLRMAQIDQEEGRLEAARNMAAHAARQDVVYDLFDERPATTMDRIDQAQRQAAAPPMPPTTAPAGPLSFHFENAPWDVVLQGYAQATGLALNMPAVPPGTLTHHDPRHFTPADAFDILNSFLFEQGFFLIRTEQTLTVVKLSDGIPRDLIREVQGGDFSPFTRSDLVSVTLPVSDADVETVARQLDPILGPLGGIERLSNPTRLRIIDTAANAVYVLQVTTARQPLPTATR